jgi:hypothetical protein
VEIASGKQASSDVIQAQGFGLTKAARQLWQRWKQIARKIGDFQARVLMTIFYYVILGPIALVLRLSSDPLAIKGTTPRGWKDTEKRHGEPMEQSRRQF